MNIQDIIRKCAEIPGISVKCNEHSTELILKTKEGNGSMTFFPLFPGLTLAYIFVHAPTWPAPDLYENGSNQKGPLLFNYCVTGRCEIVLNNENFVYVRDGELSLTERFAQNRYVYPRSFYEGMEFFVDTDEVSAQNAWLSEEFRLDFKQLCQMYCPDGSTYISAASAEAADILGRLFRLRELPVSAALPQMKIYAMALFSVLSSRRDIPPSQSCTFFTETQVTIAKRTEKIITADLRKHYPARELAEHFSVSETSLKNYFRGVFGQNISVYLREFRMKEAARLLATTKLSVSRIAEQVGYMNQSKFASVFKKQFHMSPLEYRRFRHLEQP